VLAGVVALSGAASSFLTSLVVGVAYVFGMVAPLFVVALVWDGREIGASRWLAARSVRLGFAGRKRIVPVASFAGGLLLVVMSVVVGVLAVTGPDMATRGWQATMSGAAQHYAHVVTTWLGHLPGWVTALGVFLALGALVVLAVRQVADQPETDHEDGERPPAPVDAEPPASWCADDEAADTRDVPSEIGAGLEPGPEPAGRKGP
jgi:hypothetical protein